MKSVVDKAREILEPSSDIEALAKMPPGTTGLIAQALLDCVEALDSLLKFCDELCEDLRVSKHYPSMDKARAALAKLRGESK